MGMGLNICRSIIESHQGRLWFDDNPQGGCSFRFTLPLEATPQPAEATSKPSTAMETGQ
jgi:signal transduction histidine kinase